MRKKTLFIVNPISGIGRQKRIEQLLEHNLDKDIFDYTVSYTEYIHHGSELARKAAEQGYDCVVAVGGDGSVNDVVQAPTYTWASSPQALVTGWPTASTSLSSHGLPYAPSTTSTSKRSIPSSSTTNISASMQPVWVSMPIYPE